MCKKHLLAAAALVLAMPCSLLLPNKKTIIQINEPAKEADCYVMATYPIPQAFSVTAEIERVFGADAQTALAVMKAESNGKPNAIHKNTNNTIDAGLFMINDVHGLSMEYRLNPKKNIAFAKQLYDRKGWTPWVVWQTGAYKRFL